MVNSRRAQTMPMMRDTKRLLATTSVAGLLAFSAPLMFANLAPALAQQASETNIFVESEAISQEEQLLLESDDLTFDTDRNLVIATGNVQIAYGRTTLVADRVEYNQQSGRVIALGNVEILEPNGNRIFANEIDVTDDFRDGFVSALNIQTADNTRIAAESAERRDGRVTQFNNGVYTACEQCKENPEKPPFWQIRAKKVVVDNDKRTVEYEDATFEFFGKPVLKLSRFAHADPAIKRKSGFLVPGYGQSDELGFSYRQGYFFNLAPDYDLTLWGTYFSEQGFLGEAEWRQRLANGEYSIRYAGINQQAQGNFAVGESDRNEDDRHAVITNGLFDINDRWQFGWDWLWQSDQNFARTYNIDGLDEQDITNDVFLTGLGEKNYFDLRAQQFLVQDNIQDSLPGPAGNPNGGLFPGFQTATDQQAIVLPSLDYNAVSGEEFANGQISFDLNVTSINRDAPQISNFDNVVGVAPNERFTGLEGNTTRASAFLEWKGSSISNEGLVTTAALNVQGDAIYQNTENLNLPGNASVSNPLMSNDSIYRAMPGVSLEIRYPLIAQSNGVSHIFEPIAQVIVRPDEENIGEFANEDAQSLVFDTSNLFRQNKFSGYDRVEGGTRANVGFRYSASFETGASITVVAGQSFHLAGQNSFAVTNDLVNVGQESGLETDRSDFVASVQLDNGQGFAIGTGVRLDEEDLGLRSAEVSTQISQPDYTFLGTYTYTEAQPNYRFPRDRHEVSGAASVKLDENWRVFGSTAYDIVANEFNRHSVGFAYDDDCFSFAISYSRLESNVNATSNDQSINFSIGLRTIGGFQRTVDFGGEEN